MEWVAEAATGPDLGRRFDAALLQRLQPVAIEPVQRAVRLICGARGQVTVARLESILGISARRLERSFLKRIGLTPKMFCRVARFQHTHALLSRRPQVPAGDLVQAGGFFDQSHLLREFKQMAGLLPKAWLDERQTVGFVQYIEPLLP